MHPGTLLLRIHSRSFVIIQVLKLKPAEMPFSAQQRSSVDLECLPLRKLITVLLTVALLQQKTSNILLFGD